MNEKKKKKLISINATCMNVYISKWMKIIEILFTPKTLNILKCKPKSWKISCYMEKCIFINSLSSIGVFYLLKYYAS